MTPAERERAFSRARAAVVRAQTALMRGTRDDLVAMLKAAERAIAALLADQPSDYELWALPRLQAEVRRVLAEFGEQGGARVSSAAGAAWEHGQELAEKPFDEAFKDLPGARIADSLGLQRLDAKQLSAIRAFMVDRIKNVGVEAANKITVELGLVAIGARSPSDAISALRRVLGESSRSRATTIVRTELGRVFAVASQARLEQIKARVPGVKKIWRRSGKLRPRLHHMIADGQVREVGEKFTLRPFGLPAVELMFPHDPQASAAETINCGCHSLPHFTEFRVPGGKLLTRTEHLKREGLPADAEVPGLEDDGETLQQVLKRQRRREPA